MIVNQAIPSNALPADTQNQRVGNALPAESADEPSVNYERFFQFIKQACREAVDEALAGTQPEDYGGWIDVRQAAEYLGMSEKAVRNGARCGDLPGKKYPAGSNRGHWRFRKGDLDKRLRSQQRGSGKAEISIWK